MASHVIELTINNNTDLDLTYQSDWFDSGSLSAGSSFPKTIAAGASATIKMQDKASTAKGCSGYVNYLADGGDVTFGYSNPSIGTNKLGVGNSGKGVWDDMGSHDYKPFTEKFSIGSRVCTANCICTGGETNQASVTLSFE